MNYLMGIDNGGTFVKVAIFDLDGNQVAVASNPLTAITPKSGYTERDMEELWVINAKSIRECIEKSGVSQESIKAVSFSGHGKGLYMVGYDGKPSYHGIISTDNRAWKCVEKWCEQGVDKAVYPLTYQKILACQPVSLLAWFQENEPEVLEKTEFIFHVKDYIRYKLTGEAYGEYTDSSGGNLVNLNTKAYDEELLAYFGLEKMLEKLPPLKYSADICGYVTKEASEITGLGEGIPAAAGMFDVNACGIASGLVDEEGMCMIAGTWSINEFISKYPIKNGSIGLNSMYCIPGYYLVEESSPTSAGNMEWFIKRLMGYEKMNEDEKGSSVYNITNAWVESIEPQEASVLFLPFLNGSNEDALAKGSFIGLTAFHEKKHMLRAVYEGIVFSHKTHVDRLLKNREKPTSIRLTGGATNSEVWVQIFADTLQMPIDVIEEKEIGAQGAAMVAGIASGEYDDYEHAIKQSVKVTKTIYPNIMYKEIYAKKYENYRKVVEALNPVWKQIAD